MKRIRIAENVKMIGVAEETRKGKVINYYFDIPRQNRMYVFTGPYKEIRFKLVKNGIRVNELLAIKKQSQVVMKLVEQTKRFIPYMIKEYDVPIAA